MEIHESLKPSNYYFAILSGIHPCLSFTEAESLLSGAVFDALLTQTLVFKYPGKEETLARVQEMSSTIKYIGRILALTEADPPKILEALKNGEIDCNIPEGTINVAFLRIQSFSKLVRKDWLVDIVREYFREKCRRSVRSGKPRPGYVNVLVVATDGLIIIGYLIAWKGKGQLLNDNPHDLPYYAPGALNRWLTNLLINIATTGKPTRLVWDPFCGTGTIGLPHLDRGGVFLCSEILDRHCRGSLRNMLLVARSGMPLVIRSDALHPAVRGEAVDAVVTDLPYGRSVKGKGEDELGLASKFLEEVPQLIKSGGRLVFMAPMNWWPQLKPLLKGTKLHRACPMYVHEGLTRVVVVADKP